MAVGQRDNGHADRAAGGAEAPSGDAVVLETFNGLTLKRGSSEEGVPGHISLTERSILWFPDGEETPGVTLSFQDITMHAVVRASEETSAALYLQIRGDDSEFEEGEAGDVEEDGEPAEDVETELWLIPSDPRQVDALFEAFSKGAERNPDSGSDEDDDAICFNEDEVLAGTAAALNQQEVDDLLNGDPARFSDAEESETDA